MWRQQGVFLSLLAFACAGCPGVGRSQVLNVTQALDLLEGSSQAITSFDVRVTCSCTYLVKVEGSAEVGPGKKAFKINRIRKLSPNEKPSVVRESYRQAFQDGKG